MPNFGEIGVAVYPWKRNRQRNRDIFKISVSISQIYITVSLIIKNSHLIIIIY